MKRETKTAERQTAAQMHALASVRRDIRSGDASGGRKYLREYTQAFRHYETPLTPAQLDSRIQEASVLLVGDYHALPASQGFVATLLERVGRQHPVTLGLEAILSRDQAILDSWWKREIGNQQLRERLHFDRDWGYAWQPCVDLLTSARDYAEGLYGLDCLPRNDMLRIRSRDRHAAAKICEMRQHHPNATIVVLFGESHMAPAHLPRLLRELLPNEKILTILQNVDSLYWQAVSEDAEAVAVDSDTVCVFNTSPLEKYESYRLCLERWNGDEQPDFAPAIYNLIFSLARTLGFRLDSPHNGTQPKYLSDSLPEIVNLTTASSDGTEASLSREVASDILKRVELHGSAYVGQTNTFFISEFKLPDVAHEAARFLSHACRSFNTDALTCLDENAVAYFGSRLLCPGKVEGENREGEELYQAYLQRKMTKAAARRLFLATADKAKTVKIRAATVGS